MEFLQLEKYKILTIEWIDPALLREHFKIIIVCIT